ncbi:MAG TPA: helix-turn-helix domain-containing protein [Pseudonocardiaceae bacterium]|nr:helix-turn-helix domain-containing protein [Pseudonocardiaceae bacterium]
MKRLRQAVGETQAQSAQAIGVSRANLAQWEGGKYLPSIGNARRLDEHLRADNLLVRLVVAARSRGARRQSADSRPNTADTVGSLTTVFRQVGDALLGYLVRYADGRPHGWRHNLQTDKHPTALGTAYGIRALLEVGEPYVDLGGLGESLLAMQAPQGGWMSRSGSNRPEATAAALDALFRMGTTLSADDGLAMLDESLDDFARTRPYLLSSVLQTALRLRPESPLVDRLVDDLLAARLRFDGLLLWPEKVEPGLWLPEPSVAHTARAVLALRGVMALRGIGHNRDRDDIRVASDTAIDWLVDRIHPDDGVTEELIRPTPDGEGTTRVFIRHFTSALVVQALSGVPDVPASRLHAALNTLWSRYNREISLWAWGNGDLPVWMTMDSVIALRSAALALAASPVSPPGD